MNWGYPAFMPQMNEVISGAIVDSVDVVRGKNCSLDGACSYYPLADQSAIYVKKLNPQTGAGMLLKYTLDKPETKDQVDIAKELAEIKELLQPPKSPSVMMRNGGEKHD